MEDGLVLLIFKSPCVWCKHNLIRLIFISQFSVPPTTPHQPRLPSHKGGLFLWQSGVKILGTEIQFSTNHNAIQMLPTAGWGTFYLIIVLPEKHTSPVRGGGGGREGERNYWKLIFKRQISWYDVWYSETPNVTASTGGVWTVGCSLGSGSNN